MDPVATSELTGTNAEDNAVIDSLLGGGTSGGGAASETEQETGTTTEERETETAEKESEETAEAETEEAAEEAADAEETEEAEEESDLSIEESDRDYSDAAYDKAAKHYSRTKGIQLDPKDPAHRALLKEVMDRGEALKRNQAEIEKAKAKTVEETEVPEEDKTAEPVKWTPEQIRASVDEIREIAKSRLVPEVAMAAAGRIGMSLAKMLWGEEAPKEFKPTQEAANEFITDLHSFFLMAMNDAQGAIYGMVNNNLAGDPVWGPARSEAIDARAFEHLDKTKGAEWYASMETLVDNGAIKKVISENPDIFKNIKAGNGKDPVLNRAAQLEAAYKIARGDQTIQQVTKAVETGKKQATDTAKKVAAGRVAAGTPKSGFKSGPSEGQSLVDNIVRGEGSGSKFSKAVASQLRR